MTVSYALPSLFHSNYHYNHTTNEENNTNNHNESKQQKQISFRKEKHPTFSIFFFINLIISSERLTLWVSLTSISMIYFDINL